MQWHDTPGQWNRDAKCEQGHVLRFVSRFWGSSCSCSKLSLKSPLSAGSRFGRNAAAKNESHTTETVSSQLVEATLIKTLSNRLLLPLVRPAAGEAIDLLNPIYFISLTIARAEDITPLICRHSCPIHGLKQRRVLASFPTIFHIFVSISFFLTFPLHTPSTLPFQFLPTPRMPRTTSRAI